MASPVLYRVLQWLPQVEAALALHKCHQSELERHIRSLLNAQGGTVLLNCMYGNTYRPNVRQGEGSPSHVSG